jgi:predicted dehydrogenase
VETKQINYGILGCGRHALRAHAIPGKNVPGLELKALCDISENNMAALENAYGSPLEKYTDRKQFFASNLDAILIATPDELHFRDLKDTINAGKHVFVDKPIVTTVDELNQLWPLLLSASEKDLVVTSCHLRRYNPPFVWLKDNLASLMDRLGKPLIFRFDFSYHKPSKDWKKSRGLLIDHINHEIDLVHYYFKEDSFKAKKYIDSYDQYHVMGMTGNGIRFDFSGTRMLGEKKYRELMTVRFEKGELRIDTSKATAELYDHNQDAPETIILPTFNYEIASRGTMENFVNAINKKESCYLNRLDIWLNNATGVMLTMHDEWDWNPKKAYLY